MNNEPLDTGYTKDILLYLVAKELVQKVRNASSEQEAIEIVSAFLDEFSNSVQRHTKKGE